MAELPVLELDKRTYERALSCVHCGLCLAACPTYLQTGHEADSPRGRIQLIRGLADGTVEATASVRGHLDLCLDCHACETACPSNVVYHELIEGERIGLNDKFPAGMAQRLLRWLCFHVLVHPGRLKWAVLPLRLVGSRRLPAGSWWPGRLDAVSRGGGKAKVGLLAGCVGSVLFDAVNRKAVELLNACGADVLAPEAQGCCGAIHYHGGSAEAARAMARRNIDAFMPEGGERVDFIASTAGGCGAMLREYPLLLRDDPVYAKRAEEFAKVVRDVTEVLVELGLPEMKYSVEITATYHDSCHLAHAQKVREAPRKLLAAVPGLKMVALAESDMCCGAAGTYFLTQPEMARALAARKLGNIAVTGAGVCVTGNSGCALHLMARAGVGGKALRVVHPVELVHEGVFGGGRGGKSTV